MSQYSASAAKELVITHVKGEGAFLKFWALPLAALEVVKSFENQFSSKANELESTSGFMASNQTPVGLKCAVKSKIKRQWCRARVIATPAFSEILVQLMDYGNEEAVSVTDARKVDEQIFTYPPQAVECILADVAPIYGSEWPSDTIRYCEQHLLYQTVSCFIVSHFMKIPIVRVAKKGENEPFVQRLINTGRAYIKPERSYKINTLEPNSIHRVKVSFVESVQKFYVQLIAAEIELKRMMEAIKTFTSTKQNLSLVNSVALNTPCLAQLSSKATYYRALITRVTQGRCIVQFVDYGYSEIKEFQDLIAIPQTFLSLAAQAICCSLHGDVNILPEEFEKITNLDHCDCQVLANMGDKYLVRLLLNEQEISQSYQLSPSMPMHALTFKQHKLTVGSTCDMTVSSINDMDEFFCQLLHFKEQLDALSSMLNSGCKFSPISFSECVPDLPVCVKFSEDNLWYRAKILKVNHERDIEVFFVDYGNYDNANLSDVRKIKPDLMKFPIQAYNCKLFDLQIPTDATVKDEMFDLFEELTSGQNLVAHIKSFNDKFQYGVELYEQNSSICINEKLESKILNIGTVPVSDIENLYVTNFESADSFFAQFEKLDPDKLVGMQNEINEFYLNAQNTSFVPKVGNLVCARFKEDDQFYRAVVVGVKNSYYDVCFIDYGNKEMVSHQDIHPMNKKFTKYPQFGIECALESYPSGTPMDKLRSLMLENPIQAKMVREENKKWYISLNENYSGNVAILELLRQHEHVIPRSIHGAGLGGYQEKGPKKEHSHRSASVEIPDKKENFQDHSNHWQRKENFNDQSFNKSESTHTPPKNKINVNQEEKLDHYDEIAIPSNAYRNVYVSHVISPSEFYCQIEEESPKLQVLMKNIEEIYSSMNDNDMNFSELTPNTPCCALYQLDGGWYRGLIKRINSDCCDVFFVDYGNIDGVPVSKVKVLKSDFIRFPPQAIRCKSFNVTPIRGTWNTSDIEAFIKMTLDKSFVAQFVHCDNNGTYAVNLVSIGKLQEDVLSKEFVSLGHGQLEDSSKILVLNSHAASSNLTFGSPVVPLGSFEDVIVPYGLNPGEVFCQLKSYAKEFRAMMEKLQNYYNDTSDAETIIDRPHQGMICIAQFFVDSAWYRAQIKKVEKNNITVFYVDYGNSEIVDRKKIRCITQDFTLLPVQAIRCRIRGIKPPRHSWLVNDTISQYFDGDIKCKFIAEEKGFFLIDITCNQKNVAELLIKDGLAASDENIVEKKHICSGAQNVQQSEPQPHTPVAQKTRSALERELSFVPEQLISVVVSYVESPSRFWCQLQDESEILEQLMAEIEQEYFGAPISSAYPSSLKVNDYCVAHYSEDQAWYRAQIKSFMSNNECEVFFIDYGNTEVVSASQIAAILPQFMKLPHQCFECQLYRAPLNPTSEKISTFQTLVDEAEEITAKVEGIKNGICVLSLLYDKENEEINVSDMLFGPSEETPGSQLQEPVHFLPPDVPLGLKDGYVSTVNTPQDFFIQLASSEDALAELSTELSENCETLSDEEGIINPCIGSACCAKYSEDGNWYRAEVIGLQGENADILFVDYGNVDNVPKNSLKALSGKLLQIPPYAIRCKLNGIVPVADQWSDDVINTFQEMVSECLLGITFISKDVPAIVNIAKDDKDIAQSLVDMELASVDTNAETDEAYAEDHLTAPLEDQLHSLPTDLSYPNRKLRSTKLAVKICYVDTYDKFYIMPLELSTELDTIMATLEILYSSSSDVDSVSQKTKSSVPDTLEDPRPSIPCVAKYSEDDAWYRALITDIDGDNIYVTFVDYGNSEITCLQNLKPLTPELLKIPPIALECSLFGIQAIEGKEQEITAKLEDYFVEEVELEMEVCESKPYKVKLSCNGDFAAMLIKEGYANEINKLSENLIQENSRIVFSDESTDDLSSIISQRLMPEDEVIGNFKFSEIENGYIVLHIVPNCLEEELENLQKQLNKAYSASDKNVSIVRSKGFYAAKYSEDGNWYRIQILFRDNDKLKVNFVDYGNSEFVNIADVNELLPEFIKDPQFSIKCIVCGLKSKKDKIEELQSYLNSYLTDQPVHLSICKNPHNVSGHYVTSILCEDDNINEVLLNALLVNQQYIVNQQFEGEFETFFENFENGVFYMLPLESVKERETLQACLQEVCTVSGDPVVKVNDGRLYAAKSEDMWFRASIISSSDEGAVVNLVDFQRTIAVKLSDLTLLPSKFHHEPLLLLPCIIENFEDDLKNKVMEKVSFGMILKCEVQKSFSEDYLVLVKLIVDGTDLLSKFPEEDDINESAFNSMCLSEPQEKNADLIEKSKEISSYQFDNQNVSQEQNSAEEIVYDSTEKEHFECEVDAYDVISPETIEYTDKIESMSSDLQCEQKDTASIQSITKETEGNFDCAVDVYDIANPETVEENISLNSQFLECESKDTTYEELTEKVQIDTTDCNNSCFDDDEENNAFEKNEWTENVADDFENTATENSIVPECIVIDEKINNTDSVNENSNLISIEDQGHCNTFDLSNTETSSETKYHTAELQNSELCVDSSENMLEEDVKLVSDSADFHDSSSTEILSPTELSDIRDDEGTNIETSVSDSIEDKLNEISSEDKDSYVQNKSNVPCDSKDIELNVNVDVKDSTASLPENTSEMKESVCDLVDEETTHVAEISHSSEQTTSFLENKSALTDELTSDIIEGETEELSKTSEGKITVDRTICFSEDTRESKHTIFSGSVNVIISDVAISEGSIILAVTPTVWMDQLSKLKERLHDVCSSKSNSLEEVPDSDLCAVFLEDNQWYRGRVLEFKDDSVTVMLIDYGISKSVNLSETKYLDAEEENIPPFAVWCTLASASCLSEKDCETKEYLQRTLKNKEAVIKILEGEEPYKVSLFVNDVNILTELLNNHMVKQTIVNPYIQCGSYAAQVSSLNINSDKFELFVNLCLQINDIETLSTSMQNSYESKEQNVSVVESGVYAALYNGKWVRCISTSPSEKITHLIDIGGTSTDCSNFCYLMPEHCLRPPFAIPCQIPHLQIPVAASNILELTNIFKEKEFLISIKEYHDLPTILATLIDEGIFEKLKILGLIHSDEKKSGCPDCVTKSEENISEVVGDTETENVFSEDTRTELNEQFVGYLKESFSMETTS